MMKPTTLFPEKTFDLGSWTLDANTMLLLVLPYRPANIELITITQDPVLLSTASDLISSENIVLPQIGALGEIAEPTCFGSITRRALDRTPLRSRRLWLPVATILVEAHTYVSERRICRCPETVVPTSTTTSLTDTLWPLQLSETTPQTTHRRCARERGQTRRSTRRQRPTRRLRERGQTNYYGMNLFSSEPNGYSAPNSGLPSLNTSGTSSSSATVAIQPLKRLKKDSAPAVVATSVNVTMDNIVERAESIVLVTRTSYQLYRL